jgi:pyruvate dehydrogenase E1 component alpha subunit
VVDPARYRSQADNEEAQAADPVPAFRGQLLQAGFLDEAAAAGIERDVDEQVATAVAFADNSPDPTPDQLFDYAYATPVANAPSALPGDPVVAGS